MKQVLLITAEDDGNSHNACLLLNDKIIITSYGEGGASIGALDDAALCLAEALESPLLEECIDCSEDELDWDHVIKQFIDNGKIIKT
jgi:hypothetical protein